MVRALLRLVAVDGVSKATHVNHDHCIVSGRILRKGKRPWRTSTRTAFDGSGAPFDTSPKAHA